MTDNSIRLFVYGTLAPNRVNSHILEGIGGSFEKASVRGNLYQEGWGAAQGYPGIKLDSEGSVVEGFVFKSPNLERHWQTLDDFEGAGYERVICQVVTESGKVYEAYIYALSK
ncbi:gamma-glutamylcyclotransferase family protein [Pseudoalteromonas luteoviolacea]|uniref:gamma-glutamylcyclotransferase family protein n=1 Tax=Pseudoalteromonas luteoviolacea TaxID=43657 RepID=UPI0007B07FFC|nr:gamma-glutamylcyclotransferase family protein [Pseudoalteromonas luteoviolacea]